MKTRKELCQWALDLFISKFDWEDRYSYSSDYGEEIAEPDGDVVSKILGFWNTERELERICNYLVGYILDDWAYTQEQILERCK